MEVVVAVVVAVAAAVGGVVGLEVPASELGDVSVPEERAAVNVAVSMPALPVWIVWLWFPTPGAPYH